MFSLDVIDTDKFMDMPNSTQSLYFHLGMRSDDEGFVSSPRKITRLVGCQDDDLKLLIAKGYIIPFNSGVIVIADWNINNWVRPDRKHSTLFQHEKGMLGLENGTYFLLDNLQPNDNQVTAKCHTEISIDKNSIAEHLHELSAKSQQEIKKWYEDHGKHDQDITIEDVCAINSIDWKQLGNDVAAVVKNIDWDGVSDALFEGIGAALGALAAFLQGLLEDAWNSVVDWWYDAAYEDGEFTMEGLLNGITEKLTDIGNWIDEHIFQPFMEGFRNVFGIHSPSTVMQEMGGYIIDGLKEGLLGIWEKVEWIITEFKEKLKEAFTNAKNNTISIFSSMKTKMVDIFKGMWSGMKNVINTIINGIEFMVNRVVDGINNMINALNRLSFDIPDWVPQLGGKSFGFSIPTIPTVSIPRLANGGITTGSTLANIGEAGREAVLPLENNTGWMDDLASKLASKMPDYSGAKTVMLAVDGKEFARINLPYLQDEEMRLGIVEG